MSNNHSNHIEKLKNNFHNIIGLKLEIAKKKLQVTDKLNQLKGVYTELVKLNTKKIFIFCLDSFYFQYKIFAMEIDNIDRFCILLNNRMYCDFYKLFNIILAIYKDEKYELTYTDSLVAKTFPVYKDLEPFQEYNIEDIKEIHDNILTLINDLYTQYMNKKTSIQHYNENHRVGFSISNFINTLEYENSLLEQQIDLFINYVSFFHISQKKQLARLNIRIQDFYKDVDENVNVNRTFSIHDILDEEKTDRLFNAVDDTSNDATNGDMELIDKLSKIVQPSEQNQLPEANNITTTFVERSMSTKNNKITINTNLEL